MFTFQLLQQKNTYYRILYGQRHKSCMAMGMRYFLWLVTLQEKYWLLPVR
jgi:hypothetical protein